MEIKNYRQINKGSLIARFDVAIPEWKIIIKGVSYFEKGTSKWIGLPGNSYTDKEGKTKHFACIDFEKETKLRFESKCLELIKARNYQVYAEQKESSSTLPF